MTGERAYRPDIDGLRGVAIFLVVGYHAFPQLVPGGFIGVDVFFVISGFLITGIILDSLQQQTFSFADFYMRRIRRIFPALLLVLVASLLAGWFLLLTSEYRQLGKHTVLGTLFLANFSLWQEAGYFDAAAELKPLLHLWSLGIEEQFYLAWPLALFLFARLRRGWPLLVGMVCAISLALSLGLTERDPAAAFFLPHTRLWELLLGGLLAFRQRPDRPPLPGGNLVSWLGVSLIAAAATLYAQGLAYPGWRAAIPVAGAFLVIAAGASAWPNRVLLASRLAVFVGLISYPLYLWHWPLLAFARIAGQAPPHPALTAALVALAVALAWLTYRYIERPIRFRVSATAGRRKAVLLVLAMLGCGLLGTAIFALQGVPERFPRAAQFLTDYRYDYAPAYRAGVCFIEKIEQIERAYDFSPRCVDAPADPSAAGPLVVLWGDSIAAHLYPGLSAQQSAYRFRIAQFTVATCPPILGYRSLPFCAQANEFTAARIRSLAPDTVILAAYGWTPADLPQLRETVSFLKAAGVRKIIIAGPPPRWLDALPKLLYREFSADPLHRIPRRMTHGLYDGNAQLDATWRDIAATLAVDYVSFFHALCTAEGCVTRVGEDPDQLMAWDIGHLTSAGSAFLVGQIFSSLFAAMPAAVAR